MLEGKFICTKGHPNMMTEGMIYKGQNGRIVFDDGRVSFYRSNVDEFNERYIPQIAPYEEPYTGILKINLTNFDTDEFMQGFYKSLTPISEPSIKPIQKSEPTYESFTFTYSDANNDITHTMTEETCDYDLEDVVATFVNFLKGVGFADDDIGDYIDVDML